MKKTLKKSDEKCNALLCGTCKFWGMPNEDGYINEQIPNNLVHEACEHPKVGGGSYEDEGRKGFDGLNAYESVGTGPDFGCIHWTAI